MWKISEIFMTQTLQRCGPKILQLICEKTKIPGWRRCINWCESPNTSNPQTPPIITSHKWRQNNFYCKLPFFIWSPEVKIKSTRICSITQWEYLQFPGFFGGSTHQTSKLVIHICAYNRIISFLNSLPPHHPSWQALKWKSGRRRGREWSVWHWTWRSMISIDHKKKIISNWKRKKGGKEKVKKNLSETGLIMFYWFIWAAKVTAAPQ